MRTTTLAAFSLLAAAAFAFAGPASAMKVPDIPTPSDPSPPDPPIAIQGNEATGAAGAAAGIVLRVVGEAGTDQCSGDPCATAHCTPTTADASAWGSEKASASAKAGSQQASQSQPGAAAAHAAGGSPTSASAQGKRDWSLKEANASCSSGSAAAAMGLGASCFAGEAVEAAGSFAGAVYEDGAGGYVAIDGAGRGLPFTGGVLAVADGILARLGPADPSGLAATGLTLAFELAEDAAGTACSVVLG